MLHTPVWRRRRMRSESVAFDVDLGEAGREFSAFALRGSFPYLEFLGCLVLMGQMYQGYTFSSTGVITTLSDASVVLRTRVYCF